MKGYIILDQYHRAWGCKRCSRIP